MRSAPSRQATNPFTKKSMTIPGKADRTFFWEVEQVGACVRFCRGEVGRRAFFWTRHCQDSGTAARLVAEATAWRAARGFIETASHSMQRPPEEAAASRTLAEDVDDHMGSRVRLPFDLTRSDSYSMAEAVRALARHADARLVEELRLGAVPGTDYSEAIAALGTWQLPGLSSLVVGDYEAPQVATIPSVAIGDCEPLWSLPALRSLVLQGSGIELGYVDAPKLEELEVRTRGLKRQIVDSLASAKLPALRALKLWVGGERETDVEVGDLDALFRSGLFPRLTHLGMQNADLADAFCKAIVDSPLLPKLRTLDLSLGALTDAGAKELLAHRERVAHLELIDVRYCLLSPVGLSLLAELGPSIRGDGQRKGRFAAVLE